MLKRLAPIFVFVFVLVTFSTNYAQDGGVLRVAVADYMTEPLIAAGVNDLGYEVELISINTKEEGEFSLMVTKGIEAGEFDLVIADNLNMTPVVERLSTDAFVPFCRFFPEACEPVVLDLCELRPWLCQPWPPCVLIDCPPLLWDKLIIIAPWEPMPWTVDDLIGVLEQETIMFDPANRIGFELTPAVFGMIDFEPTFTDKLEEAFLMFTTACNYVTHFDEFNEAGFVPITVDGYVENTFSVSGFIPANGSQQELAASFTNELLNNVQVQNSLFESTGLLPGNPEALGNVLPQ